MRKILLTLILVFMFVCAIPAFAAADTVTVSAPSTAREGDVVTVDVKYAAVKGFGGINFSVEFDPEVFELVEIDTEGSVCDATVTLLDDAKEGKIDFMYAGLSNITSSGRFAKLRFVVREDAVRGDSEITVSTENSENYYYDGRDTLDLEVAVQGDTVRIPLRNFTGISLNDAEYVYDGEAKALSVEGELPEGAVVEYTGNENVDVGTYTVTATVSCAGYNDLVLKKKLTVTAAELEITSFDIYSGVCEVETVYGEDDVEILTDDISVVKDGDSWKASGFVLGGEDASNYTLVTDTVDVTVSDEDIVTVSVTYEFEDADDTFETVEFFKGSDSVLKAESVSKFKFAGWYIDGSMVSSDVEYSFVAEEDIAITGKYNKKSNAVAAAVVAAASDNCTVKFNTLGGNVIDSQTVREGRIITRPEDPVKGDMTFAGWYTDREYTNAFNFDKPVRSDMTLYAKWTEGTKTTVVMTIGNVEAYVNGQPVKNDVAPIIENDRTMLPARFVAESFGATVTWDAATRTATIANNEVEIKITIDSNIAYVNGAAVALDSPAFIRNDRTYTPVRFIAEKLGATVEWDGASSTATLTK